MSRTVHLLKFYEENPEFIESVTSEEYCCAFLVLGKKYDDICKEIVERFNSESNISKSSNFHKGLSLPRLKMLIALVAQKKGFTINPSLSKQLYLNCTPERFQKKFENLLVPGFWLLGIVIKDSLSEDSCINCGNPFDFIPGDLGFWWAGIVILDWLKYTQVVKSDFVDCISFYNYHNLSRKYLYHQDSALLALDQTPEQFLQKSDMENFNLTISKVNSKTGFFMELHKGTIEKMAQCIEDALKLN